MTQVSEFNYELPADLIAQAPLEERGASRMLAVSRDRQTFRDDLFAHVDRYIRPGDCLVLNNTRVFPGRLHGLRRGVRVEVFLTQPLNAEETEWLALVKPGKRVRVGDVVEFGKGFSCEIVSHGEYGERTIRFYAQGSVRDAIDASGEVPLPPYIHRKPSETDRERYQTVFAETRGSVAAPTAGLHFTCKILEHCRQAGANIAFVTLHVGLGTFAPVRSETVEGISLHSEPFSISEESAAKIHSAKRVVCVGTTSVRTVETFALTGQLCGETSLFISPGFPFRLTGAVLTNFHLPQSTLLMLVSAFAGKDLTLRAYNHAVAERYRFFSYGDCMFIE